MAADQGDWQDLVDGLRAGDETVAREFYTAYGPLLERLAARQLHAGLRRRVGPETVAHSACRTFLRRMQDGQFSVEGRDTLWNLLCAITLAKTRKKARFHLAHKRGAQREIDAADAPEAAAAEPTPAEAAEFADQFEHLLAAMDDEERQIVCLKLEGRTNDEVAELAGCSERTVRRILKRVEQRLAETPAADD